MQNKSTRRPPVIAVLVVVALLCVLAYVFATQLVNLSGNRLRDAVSLPARSNNTIKAMENGVAYYDGSTLHALDSGGRQIWSYAAGRNANFSVGEGGVASWAGSTLSLLSKDKGTVSFSGPLAGTIVSARFGSQFVAAQIAQPVGGVVQEHNSTMEIMDSGGRAVASIPVPNKTVLDFGFFNNGSLFWVMQLDTEGTVPVTTIDIHRPGKVLVGTIADPLQVMYEVAFQSEKIRTVGKVHIKDRTYNNKEITENRILVYGWYMMDVDEQQTNPLMVFVPTAQADGSQGITDIRIIQGQSDMSLRLPSEAKQVFAKSDTVYAFTSNMVMVCRGNSMQPEAYQTTVSIDRVVALTDNHNAIVTSGGGVYLVPLP